MEPTKNKGGRPPSRKKDEKPEATTHLDSEVNRAFTAHAKKLKLTKREYASAAIAFFAESGLDPTAERAQGLGALGKQVSADTREVRVQSAEIGTRIITVIRGWQRDLYDFLQQQELSRNNHLELVESTILQHQVLVETNLLGPMVEALFKTNLEAFIGRALTVEVFVKTANVEGLTVAKQMKVSNDGRDEQLAMRMREFLRTNAVPVPRPTPKRPVTPVPGKPVAPAAPKP